jgi:hypothetical protein
VNRKIKDGNDADASNYTYDEQMICWSKVFEWHHMFKDGHESLEDSQDSGQTAI